MSPEAIQSYLRRAAAARYDAVTLPPFTAFFDPASDLTFFNYAIPDAPCGGDLGPALQVLREAFVARGRTPRLEFVAEFAPALPDALLAAGFAVESRSPLMVCDAATWRAPPPVAGLEIRELTRDAPETLLRAQLETAVRGFDPAGPPLRPEDLVRLRADLAAGARAFLALLDGAPAAAGTLNIPAEGMAELAGIATLLRFRRRGIAAALTAHMARAALDAGLRLALLGAADDRAARVYERAGFRTVATALAFAD